MRNALLIILFLAGVCGAVSYEAGGNSGAVAAGSSVVGGTANRLLSTDSSGNIATDADTTFDGTTTTLTTLSATTGSVTSLTVATTTVTGRIDLDFQKTIRWANAAGTVTPVLERQFQDKVQLTSRDGSLVLATGSAQVPGLTIDTSQNIDATPGIISVSTVAVQGLMGLRAHATPRASITPTAAGQLIFNSTGNEVCFSTGTVASSWVQIDDSTSACSN